MARSTASFLSSSTRSPPWHSNIPSAKSMAGDTGMVHRRHDRISEERLTLSTVGRGRAGRTRHHDQQPTAADTGMADVGAGLLGAAGGPPPRRGWLPRARRPVAHRAAGPVADRPAGPRAGRRPVAD